MRNHWFSAVAAAVLLGACSSQEQPSSASSQTATDAGAILAKDVAEQSGRSADARQTDEFGLPLVIVLEFPEPPPEIVGPSPPIAETPASS